MVILAFDCIQALLTEGSMSYLGVLHTAIYYAGHAYSRV